MPQMHWASPAPAPTVSGLMLAPGCAMRWWKTMVEPIRAKEIFLEAVDRGTASERDAYLDRACAGNPELRQRVDALIRSHDQTDSVLDRPAAENFSATTIIPPGGHEPDKTLYLDPSTRPDSFGRLGHYEMLEVLGEGGFGTVYKCFDDKLHRIVAIKVLALALSTSGSARQRFLREARAAAAVRDEHVIDIHAVEEKPVPFLVMEYVHGPTLQQKLDKMGPLPAKEILRIGYQTATGLAAAHKQGLIHRDVKPSNILLENGVERVKLSDFGLARAVDDASLTQSGLVAGTPMYMSPEQAQGAPVDHRTDLFSLGSVLYALCTGHSPFRADSTMAVLKRVCDDTPRAIREVNPEIPEWLVDVVNRLLAKRPEDRFQSAREVADLLTRYLAELQARGHVGLTESVKPAARPRPASQRPRLVAAVLAGIASIIVIALVIRGQWLGSRTEHASSSSSSASNE